MIEMNVKQDVMETQLSNHLKHHWAITIAAVSSMFMAIAGFVVSIALLWVKGAI
jgi:hypothetical protein